MEMGLRKKNLSIPRTLDNVGYIEVGRRYRGLVRDYIEVSEGCQEKNTHKEDKMNKIELIILWAMLLSAISLNIYVIVATFQYCTTHL